MKTILKITLLSFLACITIENAVASSFNTSLVDRMQRQRANLHEDSIDEVDTWDDADTPNTPEYLEISPAVASAAPARVRPAVPAKPAYLNPAPRPGTPFMLVTKPSLEQDNADGNFVPETTEGYLDPATASTLVRRNSLSSESMSNSSNDYTTTEDESTDAYSDSDSENDDWDEPELTPEEEAEVAAEGDAADIAYNRSTSPLKDRRKKQLRSPEMAAHSKKTRFRKTSSSRGKTSIMSAVEKNDIAGLDRLLRKTSNIVNINVQDSSGNTALHYIFVNPKLQKKITPTEMNTLVAMLLQVGANPNIVNNEGQTVLDVAMANRRTLRTTLTILEQDGGALTAAELNNIARIY